MNKLVLLVMTLFISSIIFSQESMNKILLKEGANTITYNDLELDVLLQLYGEESASHLIGEVYLRIENNGEIVTEFYIDNDKSTKKLLTKAYKNYFITFIIENDDNYLILEKAQLGKAFAISSKETCVIGEKDDAIELEITDYIHEWGDNSPFDVSETNAWNDVQYTLRVKVKDTEKTVRFFSSEIQKGYTLEIAGYTISILSDQYKNSYSLLELMVENR